ncbi:MAG TPA: non-homologous end-joining DNA ligase [Acidimicrobiales bacterium]|nr:non-homologous end-joining DNA ligase [Acidimicrobiales bacterium]
MQVEVGGRELTLSNLDKVLYPATGFTKAEVFAYYLAVAPILVPHLADRPLTLRRYPDGVEGPSFFEKHLPRGAPTWLRRAELPTSPRSTEHVEYAVIDDVASLIWAANLASLELHVPMWRIGPRDRPRPPDTMVFDLDPGEPATVVECCQVALWLAEALKAEHGWTAYPKTSGSKGLQLYVALQPSERQRTWSDGRTRDEAHRLAALMATRHPDLVLSNMRRDLRRGRVLIDWSQNHVAKTTVAPYSLRARPEPSVSTPVTWDEVSRCAASGDPASLRFLTDDVVARVEALGDLFAPLVSGD